MQSKTSQDAVFYLKRLKQSKGRTKPKQKSISAEHNCSASSHHVISELPLVVQGLFCPSYKRSWEAEKWKRPWRSLRGHWQGVKLGWGRWGNDAEISSILCRQCWGWMCAPPPPLTSWVFWEVVLQLHSRIKKFLHSPSCLVIWEWALAIAWKHVHAIASSSSRQPGLFSSTSLNVSFDLSTAINPFQLPRRGNL